LRYPDIYAFFTTQRSFAVIKNWKTALGAIGLSVSMFGAGAAYTTGAQAQTVAAVRGERGSAANIMRVRRRLETLIDQLQRDEHDYGGHRVAAIDAMQQARGQLDEALEYDRAHPGQ
jgi:membrane protein implicated in regulation of membrane protease activity